MEAVGITMRPSRGGGSVTGVLIDDWKKVKRNCWDTAKRSSWTDIIIIFIDNGTFNNFRVLIRKRRSKYMRNNIITISSRDEELEILDRNSGGSSSSFNVVVFVREQFNLI